jgi:hypothetical protein
MSLGYVIGDIKVNFNEMRKGRNSFGLGQSRVAGTCERGNELPRSVRGGVLLTSLPTISFSVTTLTQW